MGDDLVTERDERVFEAASGLASHNGVEDGDSPLCERVDELASLVDQHAETIAQQNQRIEQQNQKLRNLAQTINTLRQDLDGEVSTAGTSQLEKYASMPEQVREDTLGPSDQRAVAIYTHWDDLAERTQAGYCVSTRRNSTMKNNPAKFRVQLENVLGDDLRWVEVYRAMKAVAKLSGGEPEPDQYDRLHITGGDFEYHERATPDGSDTYKVLVKEGTQ